MSLVSLIIEALSQLRDVVITSPTDGQAITYSASTDKWINSTISSTRPAVRCYNSINIAVPDTTETALTFNTNTYDQNAPSAQHSTVSATSKLVCKQAGIYHITGIVLIEGNAVGNYRTLSIRLNGTTNIASQGSNADSVGNYGEVSCDYILALNDYVELTVYQDSGGGRNVIAAAPWSPAFMMSRIA